MDAVRLARLLVPQLCPVCRGDCDPAALVCGECIRAMNRSEVLRADPPEKVDRIVSCADHEGVPRAILAAYKFRRLTVLGELIAGFIADAAGRPDGQAILVPVPPAPLRTWVRGFDPVGLLARELRPLIGVAAAERPVLRRRGSGRQRGRGRAGRLADPPDIRPAPEAGELISGRPVVLLDDVMTTGATLTAAAMALKDSGASSILALTFTRRL